MKLRIGRVKIQTMYAARNKTWLKECVPGGFLIGSKMILKPMQFGYSIGICLDRYSEKGMRRVHGFACFSLNCRDFVPLLQNECFWENIHIDDLDTIIPSVQRSLANYQERLGTTQKIAAAELAYMKTWKSANSLLDVVQAHYLDSRSPLPKYPLTERSIRQEVNIKLPYEEEHLGWILTLVDEWKRDDFSVIQKQRVADWVDLHKVPPAFLDQGT